MLPEVVGWAGDVTEAALEAVASTKIILARSPTATIEEHSVRHWNLDINHVDCQTSHP
jgi:hypothetical protein